MIDAILDPSLKDVAQSLTLTLLYILDNPDTRRYLRPSLDIQTLLCDFVAPTPADEKEAADVAFRQESAQKVNIIK